MIEVKNLTKRYGKITALDNISFTVDTGEVLGFLGPNGAGKSTTMNIITGYISSTSGTVTVDGSEILEEPKKTKQKIGYLPEIPPLDQEPVKGLPSARRLCAGAAGQSAGDHSRRADGRT